MESSELSANATLVYAADENYVPYAALSMESALRHCDCYLDIVLLVTGDVSSDAILKLNELFRHYRTKGSLRIINMGDIFQEYDRLVSHITYAACFRLVLPDLLPNVSKCLYVDCDTLICSDLSGLFSLPLSGFYFAGVPARGYYLEEKAHRQRLGLKGDEFVYCNSGVLLMNLDEMRQDEISMRLIRTLENGWACADQDALNVVCEGRIKEIPFKYNAMVLYFDDRFAALRALVDADEYDEAERFPVIVHYACDVKPWDGGNVPFSGLWHQFANNSISGSLWRLSRITKAFPARTKLIDRAKGWFRGVRQ